MAEYINKDAVLSLIECNDKVYHYADSQLENVVYATTQAICSVVAEMQPADVQPVDSKTRLNSLYGIFAKYPHISRMQIEYDELCARLDKLCKYYDESSGQLTDKQRDLMCKQITAMRSYADILQQRINYDIQYYSKK